MTFFCFPQFDTDNVDQTNSFYSFLFVTQARVEMPNLLSDAAPLKSEMSDHFHCVVVALFGKYFIGKKHEICNFFSPLGMTPSAQKTCSLKSWAVKV